MAIEEAALGAPARFFAEVQDEDDDVVVSLAGELDLSTAGRLREVLVLPETLNAAAVRVDLTAVEFLDSCSIGVLVSACKRVRSAGGTFSVSCGDGVVLRVLQISGLIDFFDVKGVGQRAAASRVHRLGARLACEPPG